MAPLAETHKKATSVLLTKAERLSRLNAVLSGNNQITGSGRAINAADHQHILSIGFRSVYRKSQGLKLSPLEGALSGLIAAFSDDDEEVATYGKIYADNASGFFSADVAKLPDEKEYTLENLKREYKDVVLDDNALEKKGIKVVDLATTTDEEWKASSASSLTIVTDSSPEAKADVQSIIHTRIDLRKFICTKQGRDSFLGPKNEIYWAYSSANDQSKNQWGLTAVEGSIVTGSERYFPKEYILFNGTVNPQKCIAFHIECWEHDTSGETHLKKLGEQLSAIGDVLSLMAFSLSFAPGLGLVGDIGGALGDILGFVGIILQVFQNKDDLVKYRNITLDQAALRSLANRPLSRDAWWFNGNENGGVAGAHDLYLEMRSARDG